MFTFMAENNDCSLIVYPSLSNRVVLKFMKNFCREACFEHKSNNSLGWVPFPKNIKNKIGQN